MSDFLLTKEEMDGIVGNTWCRSDSGTREWEPEKVIETTQTIVLRKVVEWLKEHCKVPTGSRGLYLEPEDWEALRRGVGLEYIPPSVAKLPSDERRD